MGDLLVFPITVKTVGEYIEEYKKVEEYLEECKSDAFSLRCDRCVYEWITEDKDERCPLCDNGEHVDIVHCWGSE